MRLFRRTRPTHPINDVTAPIADVIRQWDHDRLRRRDVQRHGLSTVLVDYRGLVDPMVHRRRTEGIPPSPGGDLLDRVLAER